MDTSTLWRSAVVQLVTVAVLSIILAILLPHSFFDTWGWVTGPVAWMLCAALTARLLDLPLGPTLLGALLAGMPSVICVIIGAHTVGEVIAVVLFALWCGRLPRQPALTA
ncbi:MAG TPA: hypothetical protein VGH14_22410 [Solirubrobacterales bacterium]|jgi:hypothetical protein